MAIVSGTLTHMDEKVRVIGFHAPRVSNPELDPVQSTTSDSSGNWSANLPVGGSFRVSINARCWAYVNGGELLEVSGPMTGVVLCAGCEKT